MKYILLDKNKRRVMEFRINQKDNSFIDGDIYKIYDNGKDEPHHCSYHMSVNLRYEGICNIVYKGIKGDGKYYVCGVRGLMNHMLVYSFLSEIATIESKNSTGYVDRFDKLNDLGLLKDYSVEFLEKETYIPTRCKSCSHLKGTDCSRESLETGEVGVCWYEEGR